MSGVRSDQEQAPAAAPPAALRLHVDVSQLDDKHLSQYRHPNERWALLAIAVGAVAVVVVLWLARPFIGSLLSFLPGPFVDLFVRWIHPTRIVPILIIVVVVAWIMDVVGQTTRSWQLVAQAVEVTPTTFPQLAPIIDELRRRFDLPKTRVYVSRNAPLTGYTIGIREPYAIVFSAISVGSQTPDEFKFVLGREIGHIKLGHTLAATVLGSAQMQLPQPISFILKIRSVLFGSYQQAQELSSDRIGVVATRDVRPALSALVKQNLGSVRGAKIDHKSLAPQQAQLRHGLSARVLKASQMMSPQPFPISRLAELTAWAGEPEEAPATPSPAPAAAHPAPATSSVSPTSASEQAPAPAAPSTTSVAPAVAADVTPSASVGSLGADAAPPAPAPEASAPTTPELQAPIAPSGVATVDVDPSGGGKVNASPVEPVRPTVARPDA